MIEARDLCKRCGSATAVNDLSFSIRLSIVTGFLGPNGAGRTTSTRMILDLDAPTGPLQAVTHETGSIADAASGGKRRRARGTSNCVRAPRSADHPPRTTPTDTLSASAERRLYPLAWLTICEQNMPPRSPACPRRERGLVRHTDRHFVHSPHGLRSGTASRR